VAADDRAHLAGHLGELPGPPAGIGLGDVELGERLVQGHHLRGRHLRDHLRAHYALGEPRLASGRRMNGSW